MNIPAITTYARKHVFESARFYYYMLWVVLGYSIIKQSARKILWVVFDLDFNSQILGLVVYGLLGASLVISLFILLKKVNKRIIIYICTISFVVLIQLVFEFSGPINSSSISYNKLYYLLKYLFPFLFCGIWVTLDGYMVNKKHFFGVLKKLLVFNSVFIVIGVLFSVEIFKSYPLSGRWGYSGLLWSGGMNNILYGICLMYHWSTERKFDSVFMLLSLSLLLMGQKSAVLYLTLILFFVVNQSVFIKTLFFSGTTLIVLSAEKVISFLSGLNPFWNSVYENHGAWGVLLSLRNENIERILNAQITNEGLISKFLFGGFATFPDRVEMYPIDVFFYFGAVGLIATVIFYAKWIPKFMYAIPVVVASFGGQLYDIIPAMLVFFVWSRFDIPKKK